MLYREDIYNWEWFLRNMTFCANNHANQWNEITKFIERIDNIVGKITCREMSLFTKRPQDYVIPMMVTNAFRIAISGLYLASSGYPDVVPILDRVIWEIRTRLYHLNQAPVEISMAYMLNSKTNEIKTVRAEIKHRQNRNINCQGFIKSLTVLENSYFEISKHAEILGYNPVDIEKSYRCLSLKDICKKLDKKYQSDGIITGQCIEKSYNVDYISLCGYSHGLDKASNTFLNLQGKKLEFNMGPIQSLECLAAAIDVVNNILNVIAIGVDIIEDDNLYDDCKKLLDEADDTIDKIFPMVY
jgi:hypothetical protein